MVEFKRNRRMFGALNDKLKRWLGAKLESRGLFVFISERERTWSQYLGISGLN